MTRRDWRRRPVAARFTDHQVFQMRAPILLSLLLGLACGSSEPPARPVESPPVVPPEAYARPAYTRLSETGLFSDFGARTVSADVLPFAPGNVLWADDATKERWLH